MAYTSNSPLFRDLTDEEEQKFRLYAQKNDPGRDDWSVFHPVCREEWLKRGLKPNCHADKPPENELPVADGIFRVDDTAQSNAEGRPVFKWSLMIKGPDDYASALWEGSDLSGPVMGPEPSERDMLRTFLSFLSAALESRSYRERTGRPGENEDLFPADMLDWCAQHSDEISVAAVDPE